jgi:hypothetical protein
MVRLLRAARGNRLRIGVVALAIGCAAALSVVGAQASAQTDGHGGNKIVAQRNAKRLLREVVLPAGAQSLAAAPSGDGGLLRGPFQIPSGNLVDLHHLWRVPKPLDSVLAYVKARPPRDAPKTGSGGGSVGGPGYPPNHTLIFTLPGLPGRVSYRWLDITLVALPGNKTGVRADAQEIWIVPRPRTEVVPRGVREIGGSVHVVDRANVARIMRWFDRLPTVQPGDIHCPGELGPPKTFTLSFRSASGTVLARASFTAWGTSYSLISGRCNPVEFSIRGKRRTPLIGGHFLLRVEHLLGTTL